MLVRWARSIPARGTSTSRQSQMRMRCECDAGLLDRSSSSHVIPVPAPTTAIPSTTRLIITSMLTYCVVVSPSRALDAPVGRLSLRRRLRVSSGRIKNRQQACQKRWAYWEAKPWLLDGARSGGGVNGER